MQKFRLSGAPQKQDGWYVVPGRVDVACWVLLGFFVLTLVLMAWFAQLGHGAG
jgi:SSS family solute:Na+ symporter